MAYKCMMNLEAKWNNIVQEVIDEGTANTVDGKWSARIKDLADRYDDAGPFIAEIIAEMLSERNEVDRIDLTDDAFRINFNLEHCTFYQKALFDPARMQTTSVYTVAENDRTPHHFYSDLAGGYSFAYFSARQLRNLQSNHHDSIPVAELMPLLVTDYNYKEEAQRLFSPMTEKEAERKLTAPEGIAFHITLDIGQKNVHIQPLPGADECSLPELTIPLFGRGFTMEGLDQIASSPETCFASNENMEMDSVLLYEKAFRQSIFHNLKRFEEQSESLRQGDCNHQMGGMSFG